MCLLTSNEEYERLLEEFDKLPICLKELRKLKAQNQKLKAEIKILKDLRGMIVTDIKILKESDKK